VDVRCVGLTENDGRENDGPSKLQGMKLQDTKMQDMKMTDRNDGMAQSYRRERPCEMCSPSYKYYSSRASFLS